MVTDYPFLTCTICGFIGCGSKEDIKQARKLNHLIEWQKEKPKDIPDSEIKDCTIQNESEIEYDEFKDDFMDYLDY